MMPKFSKLFQLRTYKIEIRFGMKWKVSVVVVLVKCHLPNYKFYVNLISRVFNDSIHMSKYTFNNISTAGFDLNILLKREQNIYRWWHWVRHSHNTNTRKCSVQKYPFSICVEHDFKYNVGSKFILWYRIILIISSIKLTGYMLQPVFITFFGYWKK